MAKNTGFLYKSYNFVDKDPIIDKMRSAVNGHKYSEISDKSGVSVTTLHNWFKGNTRRPQYATVVAVMRSLGFKEQFVRKNARVSQTRRKGNDNAKRSPIRTEDPDS